MNGIDLRPLAGSVAWDTTDRGGTRRRLVTDRVTETPDVITHHTTLTVTHPGSAKSFVKKSTQKFQKFLVVNGPLAGQRLAVQDPAAQDYVLFNRSGSHGMSLSGARWNDIPKAVLIHIVSLRSS